MDKFEMWSRNVVDKYKDLSNEEIKENLKKSALPCAVLMSQVAGDYNFGCVVRNCNNFNVSKIFYFGRKHFDRRGAVGSYHYSDVEFLRDFSDIVALKKEYVFVGLENNKKNTIPIKDFVWQENSIIVLGEEGSGIPNDILELLDYVVEIPTIGSVRSINVASAAAIAVYDYFIKFKANK